MKENELQFLYEAGGRRFSRSLYNDIEIIWSQDVHNPKGLLISADSFARMYGYASAEEMLADDQFLDLINRFMKETGAPFPFITHKDGGK